MNMEFFKEGKPPSLFLYLNSSAVQPFGKVKKQMKRQL